ncbi:hypothetical protein A0256_15855 [Mucilaginibacter sp. PAMC 26640]|nr:hypothetical protein A0256_15855 [Mucilaginibacter sp. PAMC 26640]
MKLLLHIFLSVCSIAAVNTARAQFVHEKDYKPVTTKDYTEMVGSPYLYDDWVPGTVKLSNGVSSKDEMLLKYDLLNDEVYFKDKSGETMAFVVPVQEFILNPTVIDATAASIYRSGYKGVEGSKPSAFYEVLSDGKVQLLKKVSKIIFESQNIGSATKTKTFMDKTKYYLVINGAVLAIKNDKKSLLTALSDKQVALAEYLKTNKINFKNDNELGKLVNYYNTL